MVSGAAYSNCGQKDAQQSKDELDVRTTAKETITDVKVRCLGPDQALVDIYQTVTGSGSTELLTFAHGSSSRNRAWLGVRATRR